MLKNKFFADSDSSSSEDDEPTISAPASTINADTFRVSYYGNSEDDEEKVKRVARSKTERRNEKIEPLIQKIENAIDTRDISSAYENFENLIDIHSTPSHLPIFHQLDQFVHQCWNDQDWYNQLNKSDLYQLTILRQKLRRYFHQSTMAIDEVVVTHSREDEILKELDQIHSNRGKRSINRNEQIESLNALREEANLNHSILAEIFLTQIILCLDQQNHQYFQRALDYFEELITILPELTDEKLITLLVGMNEEYKKILRRTDPHSNEYIERLRDESRLCEILERLKISFESTNQSEHICTIYLLILEHQYYKPNSSSIESLDHLCQFVDLNDTLTSTCTRVNLYQIYHLALHDQYYQARKLMSIFRLQGYIHPSNISMRILYNRTMVQLGLCAFRHGEIVEAYQALVYLQSKHRRKELLGQDDQSTSLPYHMHLNLRLMEGIYLISAMLVELPSRKTQRMSKRFYMILTEARRQPILAPPESIRDYIIAASNALINADWRSCLKFLVNETMHKQIWKSVPRASEVIEMLTHQIKEASLRIYFLTSALSFSNISISNLIEMFELSSKHVHQIISKMIIEKELPASIDSSEGILWIHSNDHSLIENLGVELTEKLSDLHQSFFSSMFK